MRTKDSSDPDRDRPASRILVVGNAGTGKSTLARRLAALTGLPVVHLDQHYWRPGWDATPTELWRQRVAQLVEQPRWVMDGNYAGTLDLRVRAADLVVFLDLPRRTALSRVVLRRYGWLGHARAEPIPGCPDRVTTDFLRWIWHYPRVGRVQVLTAVTTAGAQDRLIRLTSRRATRRWLRSLT